MRSARINADGAGYYHCMSRIIERRMILEDNEKERLLTLMRALAAFSGLEILAYSFMSSHFHILTYVPERQDISDTELIRRLHFIYTGAEVDLIASTYTCRVGRRGLDRMAGRFVAASRRWKWKRSSKQVAHSQCMSCCAAGCGTSQTVSSWADGNLSRVSLPDIAAGSAQNERPAPARCVSEIGWAFARCATFGLPQSRGRESSLTRCPHSDQGRRVPRLRIQTILSPTFETKAAQVRLRNPPLPPAMAAFSHLRHTTHRYPPPKSSVSATFRYFVCPRKAL